MKFNLNSFLMSVSLALDMSEKEILGVDIYHARKVAYVSLRIAQSLGLKDDECFDICALAILHDNGITEAVLKSNISINKGDFYQLENIVEHCSIGEKNIKNFPFFTNTKNVIMFHHENYDGSGFFGKKGDDIPLLAQIISFADELDFNFNLSDDTLDNRKKIENYVKENINIKHSKTLADIFLKLSTARAFWLDQQDITIVKSIQKYLPEISIEIDLENLFEMSKVFSKIIDSKSSFTSRHTSGLINKAEEMAHYYNFDENRLLKFKIAASLHDLGKLAIPNKILEKNGPLDESEFDKIKTHTYFTNFMLSGIDGFEEINEWAFSHHERLDGSGYPFGLSADQLSFEARLMSCLDIYQALTEDRPYRKASNHKNVMTILNDMSTNGYIDKNIVEDIDKYFDREVFN